MKKAKILYIITQSQWGGAQRYVFDLAVNFHAKFDVAVVCGGDGELIERLQNKNIKVYRLKNLVREINPWKDICGLWEIYSLIKKENPDIVHTNSSKAEILGNIAAWLAGVKKIIFTAHGFVFNEDLGFCKKKFYIFWEKLAGIFADKIICVSNFDWKTGINKKIAKEEKFVTIHNGTGEICGDLVRDGGNAERKIIIGTVANFYRNKALEYFIRAAATLNKKYSNLEFQIVGDGEERNFLESEIERLKVINLKLLKLKIDEVDYFLKSLDIFVLPSIKEGFPYVILEAMSAGLSIVATRVGGVPEAIIDGENGFLVDAKNSEALAEKIAELINNKEKREEFGRKGAERVRKEFSLEKMLEKTEEIYLA